MPQTLAVAAELFTELKRRLHTAYGPRLRHVLIYGSEARGESGQESDLDILVVLNGPLQLGADLDTAITALYPLQLQLDRPIHVLPVAARDYEGGVSALLREVKREGMEL